MAADSSTLAQMRTYLEGLTGTTNDATYPGSTQELQDINRAYLKTAYLHFWPQTMKRFADVMIANVDRYDLQSDFREFGFMRQQGMPLEPTSIDHVTDSFNKWATVLDTNEYILANLPTTASTAYTFAGSYSAGSAVVITLNSVNGISAGDEVWISDGATSEFTKVQSADGVAITITVKLKNSHNNKTLYRVAELNYFNYQKLVTPLAAAGDIPVTPGETHLIIPEYAANLYYKRIEEPDRAQSHLDTWTDEIEESWLAWSKTEAGESGQFVL